MDVEVIVGDYSSKDKRSLLARCEAIRTEYDGFLHSGIIHYIQGKMPDFTLKAAISEILDNCPSVWPEDLPERVDKHEEVEITAAMKSEFQKLNDGLILPIEGVDVVEIIKLGKEFLKLESLE